MAEVKNDDVKQDGGSKQSDVEQMPQAGTGSRDLSNWRKLAQVRAAMQSDSQANPSAVLGQLGLAANDADSAQAFSELEKQLKGASPDVLGVDLMADRLEAVNVDTNVNADVNVNAGVNALVVVNAGGAVNVGGAALVVTVAAVPVVVAGSGVEEDG